jgi:hypothetical protein
MGRDATDRRGTGYCDSCPVAPPEVVFWYCLGEEGVKG